MNKWPDGKPYYSLDHYYKQYYGSKAYKLALDIGTTCPNRDGTLSTRGCIYCSSKGSGDYAAKRNHDLAQQIHDAVELVSGKYQGDIFVAYLQSYSNTYGEANHLLSVYREILSHPSIKGLSIGTRPDCLSVEVLDGLEILAKSYPIWIELGLQTIHPRSANYINRCYSLSVFEHAVEELYKRQLPVIVHLIAGLPTENTQDFLESIRYLNTQSIAGVKFHMLHVLKGTPLDDIYTDTPFPLLSMETYCNLLCDAVAELSPNIVIHRLTGDGPKDLVVAPRWTLDKRRVLNTLHRTFKSRQLWQGKYYISRRR